jgi:SAM-dependent methyltransferase
MDEWARKNLVCPRDYSALEFANNVLFCGEGHKYHVVDGIPIMLLPDVPQTLWVSNASLETGRLAHNQPGSNLFVESLGLSEHERSSLSKEEVNSADVDPVVKYIVQATCGNLYKPLVRRLTKYPIPELRLPEGKGELFLDAGCNWGRWCIAAARKGYRVVGIDPSFGAVVAARRVSAQLGVSATYIVADARFLPFPAGSFDFVFSYSVFQHFSIKDVRASLKEIARILKINGTSLIQMANAYGLRSLTHQAHRGFREARDFEVRYWTPRALKEVFGELIGTTSLEVDGYFGLGIQKTDTGLLPFKYRLVVYLSELMRATSKRLHWLENLADSVYVRSARGDRKTENLHSHTTIRVEAT